MCSAKMAGVRGDVVAKVTAALTHPAPQREGDA